MERGMRMDVFWCLDYNLIKRGLEKEGASVMCFVLCSITARVDGKKKRCYKSVVLVRWLLLGFWVKMAHGRIG